jgi:hypothetical protein
MKMLSTYTAIFGIMLSGVHGSVDAEATFVKEEQKIMN